MHRVSVLSAAVLTLALASGARADGLAVTPNLNITGPGVDLTYRVSPRFNVRVGGTLPATPEVEDVKFGDVKYDTTFKLGGLDAFLDWHPRAGNFHVSAGVISLRSPWTLKAASTSTYKINDVSYPASGVGRLSGEYRIGNRIAPTVLFGWGNPVRPGKRWGAVLDLGIAYLGSTDFVLQADGPLAGDPAFQSDLKQEQKEQSSAHSISPLIKLGFSYQF